MSTLKHKLVLATSSERRISFLRKYCNDLVVIKPDIEEIVMNDPLETIRVNSMNKVQSVYSKSPDYSIIIGIDTVIYHPDYGVFIKPQGRYDAELMLKILSDTIHSVYSGIYIKSKPENIEVFKYSVSKVKFMNLSEDIIEWYLSTNEWVDKAGGYAIQGYAGLFIEWIEGDIYNVIGVPLNTIYKVLRDVFDFDLLKCSDK